MPAVPWAPPKSNPVLTAVLAPLGVSLRAIEHQDLLTDRVAQLIRQEGRESALLAIRAAMPLDHDFLGLPMEEWAAELMAAGELVEARLGEAVPGPWPMKVNAPSAQAKAALESTDLETWLRLAIPYEPDLP